MFYDRDIDYKACVNHELVVRTPQGTVKAGESFANKVLDKVLRPDNPEEVRDRITIVSGKYDRATKCQRSAGVLNKIAKTQAAKNSRNTELKANFG